MKRVSLSSGQKLELFNNLYTMISSGISLSESVDLLLLETKGSERVLMNDLKHSIEEGKTIASTFAKYPDVFDQVTIDLIRIGEESGKLDTVLKDIEQNLKEDTAFMQKIQNALIYPIFILLVFAGVMMLMFVFVIPRISRVFDKLRIEMPLPTKILVFASHVVINYYPFLIAGIATILTVVFILYRNKKKAFLSFFFSLPLLHRIAIEVDIARVCRNTGLMLSSGVPLLAALELAEGIIIQNSVRSVFQTVIQKVGEGKTISDGMRQHIDVMTPVAVRMIETGERAGKLDYVFANVGERFSSRISRKLEHITTLIEPVLMLVISLAIGGMMVAIMAPIYGIIGQIGKR